MKYYKLKNGIIISVSLKYYESFARCNIVYMPPTIDKTYYDYWKHITLIPSDYNIALGGAYGNGFDVEKQITRKQYLEITTEPKDWY